eukprot:6055323-Karenia_brevis.AAC.1
MHYLGKKPVHIMDGASYHKIQDPNYAPLHGPGGVYGPVGSESDARAGWHKNRCIEWLDTCDAQWLEQLPQEP